jgi:hypothetical protein
MRFLAAAITLKNCRKLIITSFFTLLLTSSDPISFVCAGEIGANKFDLLLQYLPSSQANPDAGDGSLFIRRAMAKKAIADAHDSGLSFLRVSVSGYFPVSIDDRKNDLALWQNDPARFWAATDEMFDDLDRAGIRLVPTLMWNLTQFSALGHDNLTTFMSIPQSRSRHLLTKYVSDFITRYRQRKTILFYELTNELNLFADIDLTRKCPKQKIPACVWGNFTTNDMIELSRSMARLIRSLDPSRRLSSGFSLPRPAAMHLMRRPQFAATGPDWSPDSLAEFKRYLLAIHEPFDVISVHLYPAKQNVRFGRPDGQEYELVSDAVAAARSAGKLLFVGEFGDVAGATPFMSRVLDKIVSNQVDFAAVWVWEFYQTSTYQTHNTEPTRYTIEPGYSDDVIQMLIQTEQRMGYRPSDTNAKARPRVILTWPLPCAAIDQTVTLAAVASDGVRGVREVEFSIDGHLLGTVAVPPYYASFDPARFGQRAANIKVRAVAVSGAWVEFNSKVKLGRDQSACTVPR